MGKLRQFFIKRLESTIGFLDRLLVMLGGTTQVDKGFIPEAGIEAAPEPLVPPDAKAWDASIQVLQAILTGDEVSQEEIQELENYWTEKWKHEQQPDQAEVWEPVYTQQWREKTEEQQQLENMWERDEDDIADHMDLVENLAEHIKAGEFNFNPEKETLYLRNDWRTSGKFDLQKWSVDHQAEKANPHTVQTLKEFRTKISESEKTLYLLN